VGKVVMALIGAALVAAPSATPGTALVVLARSVTRTAPLPANVVTAFTLRCPSGYAASSGGVETPAPGVSTLGIRSVGATAYAFRFGNPAGSPRRTVRVAVACRRISASKRDTAPHFELRRLETRPLAVAAQGRKQVSLSCPSGTAPVGAGFELDLRRSGSAAGFSGSPLSLRRETRNLRSFVFAVGNSGRARHSVVFYGTCLTVVRPAGAPRARLQVKVVTSTTPLPPGGGQVVKDTCPTGWFSLATGYSLPKQVTLEGSSASARGGSWSLTNAASGQALADLQLVCGRIV
jgi:hypothetical protein